jgi:hypothetical protein
MAAWLEQEIDAAQKKRRSRASQLRLEFVARND